MSKISTEEAIKIVNAIPQSKLNELVSHMNKLQGSGKGKKGAGFWGDAWGWIKKNVAPVLGEVAKTVVKDILLPIVKQKISQKLGGGLSVAGGKKTAKKGTGLKVAGSGGRLIKGSLAAKERMAALRAMRKPKKC